MQIPAVVQYPSNESIFEEILQQYSSKCFDIQEAQIKDEYQEAEVTCKDTKIQVEEKLEETEQFWSNIHDEPQENFIEVKEEANNEEMFLKIKKVQLLREEQEAKLCELMKSQREGNHRSQNSQGLTNKSLYYPSKSLSPRKTKKIQKLTSAFHCERS